jgi:hypothetical protein
MKWKARRGALRVACLVSALCSSAWLTAAPNRMAELMARARAEGLMRPAAVTSTSGSPDFGTADLTTVNVGAYEFQGAVTRRSVSPRA